MENLRTLARLVVASNQYLKDGGQVEAIMPLLQVAFYVLGNEALMPLEFGDDSTADMTIKELN